MHIACAEPTKSKLETKMVVEVRVGLALFKMDFFF